MSLLVTDQAAEVLTHDGYRSDEWYTLRRAGITASEIAAVLGLSPWVSRFDLWWEKRTGAGSEHENKAMSRGRRYEALILEDFAADHPEFAVHPVGLVANVERPWQLATPDGLAYERFDSPAFRGLPVAAIEAKSGGNRHEWGEPGTDEIPMHYRCQVLWQLDTLGLNVGYVPVVFGFEYAEYVVEYHEADVKLMREAAEEFLADVREDRQPDPDAHKATTRRLKHLHPDLIDDEAEVPPAAVRQYHAAKRLRDAAEARMRLAENRVRHALGNNRTAVVDGRKVATRSVSDIKERTQTVRAHTRNSIRFTKPQED